MIASQMVHDGTRGRIVRAPSKFGTAQLQASGDVWTPASGKRFRLLRYSVEVTGDAYLAEAGQILLQLFDAAGNTEMKHRIALPGSAPATPGAGYNSGWIDLGGLGILSAAADQKLRVVLNTSLAGGYITVRFAGTEELPADAMS